MCNREISSRRIDWFFPRSSTTIRGRSPGGGGSYPPPPDRPRYEKCPDRARVKSTELGGHFTADVTAVRPLICVYAAVSREMTEPGERVTADVTVVRSFICVHTAVSL